MHFPLKVEGKHVEVTHDTSYVLQQGQTEYVNCDSLEYYKGIMGDLINYKAVPVHCPDSKTVIIRDSVKVTDTILDTKLVTALKYQLNTANNNLAEVNKNPVKYAYTHSFMLMVGNDLVALFVIAILFFIVKKLL